MADQADVNKAFDELRRFPFVRAHVEGLALHGAVREIMDEYLRVLNPERHRELHERVAGYFETQIAKRTGEEAARLGLERLYHRIRTDEETGIELFQKMAEELVRLQLVNRLRALLSDANTYPLEHENSRLWREYYNARLAQHEFRMADAEKVYQAIGENERADPKLRAYALCDWGELLASRKARRPARRMGQSPWHSAAKSEACPQNGLQVDIYLPRLNDLYAIRCEWDKALPYLMQYQKWFEENGDKHGAVLASKAVKERQALVGNWREAIDAQERGMQELSSCSEEDDFLRSKLISGAMWLSVWTGRYKQSEVESRYCLTYAREKNARDWIASGCKNLAVALGMQGRYDEAQESFAASEKAIETSEADSWEDQRAVTWGSWGKVFVAQGKLDEAEKKLRDSLAKKEEIRDDLGIPELLNSLAEIRELLSKWSSAESYYRKTLDDSHRRIGRRYFMCGALTGLIRVKHAQVDFAAIRHSSRKRSNSHSSLSITIIWPRSG